MRIWPDDNPDMLCIVGSFFRPLAATRTAPSPDLALCNSSASRQSRMGRCLGCHFHRSSPLIHKPGRCVAQRMWLKILLGFCLCHCAPRLLATPWEYFGEKGGANQEPHPDLEASPGTTVIF